MLLEKFVKYSRQLSLNDFIRKVLYFLFIKIKDFFTLYRKFKAWLYFKRFDVHLGEGILFRGLTFKVKVGRDFRIYDNVIFEFSSNSMFSVGEHCVISYGVLIACNESITIGDHVQIGEYSSVRDTTHSYKSTDEPMKFQKDISAEISIGNDVWIGRGCIIMPGTTIGNGVIIGSNSVVKGTLEDYGVYAGAPARLIKKRIFEVNNLQSSLGMMS
ncbi:acyltransferase [Botryobacter ruber]|uniref:acyltransferase n=1 Tax=Botryobacter ruber TaxID=2171629 RepID=UPI000E0AC885|nr:acyltransferase [Botryobacter ruber]